MDATTSRLRRSTPPRVKDAIRKRDEVMEILRGLTNERLLDLARRGEETAEVDGFGAGGEGGGGQKGAVPRPTEQMALRRLDQRVIDPTGDAIEQIYAQVTEVHGICKSLRQCCEAVEHVRDSNIGRESSLQGDCLACGRSVSGVDPDRLRSGYCDYSSEAEQAGCYRKWLQFRKERPDDHVGFRAWIRAQREAKAS